MKRHHKEQNKLQNGETSSPRTANYRMVKRHHKEQNKLQNGEASSERTEQTTEW